MVLREIGVEIQSEWEESLERRILASTEERHDQFQARIGADLDTELEAHIAVQKDGFEARIRALDEKIEARIGALDKKFETRIGALDEKFEAHIGVLDEKLQKVGTRTQAL